MGKELVLRDQKIESAIDENKKPITKKTRKSLQLLPPLVFWKHPSHKKLHNNLVPEQLPQIRLTPQGFSFEGVRFNLNSLPLKLQNCLRLMLSFNLITRLADADSEQAYYFKDISNLTYKLWLSGVENLSSVITQLQAGQCNTTDSDYIPKELVQIEAFYDHGGTVPLYAATLSRDKNGVTNQLVYQCVSGLIKTAHDAWQKEATSGSSIGIILGVLGGAALVAGIAAYTYFRCRKKSAENYNSLPMTKYSV